MKQNLLLQYYFRIRLTLIVALMVPLGLTVSYADNIENERDVTISGVVTDKEDGITLPGVNVVIKGTTTGTVTDIDGNFNINVSSPNAVLLVSFIGFSTQEISVTNNFIATDNSS